MFEVASNNVDSFWMKMFEGVHLHGEFNSKEQIFHKHQEDGAFVPETEKE